MFSKDHTMYYMWRLHFFFFFFPQYVPRSLWSEARTKSDDYYIKIYMLNDKGEEMLQCFRKYYYRENVSLLFKIFNQKLEFCDNTCFMPLNCGNIADTTLHSIKPVNLVLCFVIIRILWIF